MANMIDLKHGRMHLKSNATRREKIGSPFSNRTIKQNVGRLLSRNQTRVTSPTNDRTRLFSQEQPNRKHLPSEKVSNLLLFQDDSLAKAFDKLFSVENSILKTIDKEHQNFVKSRIRPPTESKKKPKNLKMNNMTISNLKQIVTIYS